MRTLKAGYLGKEIKLYEDLKELPIDVYHDFNKLLMQDFGIGADMDSIGRHFQRLHGMIKNEKNFEAMKEAKNLHNNFFYIISGINLKSYCFACMVYSVGGKKVKARSKEDADQVLKQIEGISQGEVEDIVGSLKKKLTANLEPIFLINSEQPAKSTPSSNLNHKPLQGLNIFKTTFRAIKEMLKGSWKLLSE